MEILIVIKVAVVFLTIFIEGFNLLNYAQFFSGKKTTLERIVEKKQAIQRIKLNKEFL